MSGERIQDIPSFTDLLNNIHDLSKLQRVLPALNMLNMILGHARVPKAETDAQRAVLIELAEKAKELVTLPDRFNNLFAERGWIMYEMMAVPVAQSAVALAELGNLNEAEQLLTNYYEEETIRIHLTVLC